MVWAVLLERHRGASQIELSHAGPRDVLQPQPNATFSDLWHGHGHCPACLASRTVGYDGPLMENLNPKPWTRHHVPDNTLGLTGMDHAALAVHDVERAVHFYQEA